MKFLIYLLNCLPDGIVAVIGRSDLVTDDIVKLIIGVLEVLIISGLYVFFNIVVYKNKKNNVLLSILTVLITILIFSLTCIVVECIVN